MTTIETCRTAGWADILSGGNLVRSLALSGGVALHAVNLYISTTILPSVVREIGGMEYYALNTTLFVVASILGAALSTPLLVKAGPRASYGLATLVFIVGTIICGTSSIMEALLAGRVVQGFGGGALLALAYAMVSRIYPEALWSRALALMSSMWGIATLIGPAIGGVFAQYELWRGAFLVLVPFAGLNALGALVILPKGRRKDALISPLPIVQLVLLTIAVFAASLSGILHDPGSIVIAAAVAMLLVAGFIMVERRSVIKLLPASTFRYPATLGSLYVSSALLAVTVTCTEIFLPLFLQELHGRSPLEAGYIAAVMSAGWTAAAIVASGLHTKRRERAMHAGPLLSLCTMLILAGIIPLTGGSIDWLPLALICIALIIGGVGVGLAYPTLSAMVLHVAPPGDEDGAASSIMTIQLCATAFGAAFAGLVVNLAGGASESGVFDAANAARWLFITVAIAPTICLIVMRSRTFSLASNQSRVGA